MNDQDIQNQPAKSSEQPWLPSENLRRWLLVGAVAVVASVVLSGVSSTIELVRTAPPQGFTISHALDLALLPPQILVLIVFLALAKETQSVGLWRSSIGVFGCWWLFMALVYPLDIWGEGWGILISLGVAVAAIVLVAIVAWQPASFSSPTTESSAVEGNQEIASASSAQKSGWPAWWVMIPVTFLALKYGGRHLRGIDLGALLIILIGVVVACGIVGFGIWFAVCKIQLRSKIGMIAAVSGWMDLFSLAVWLGVLGYLISIVASQPLDQEEITYTDPRFPIGVGIGAGYSLLCWAAVALAFLSARGRSKAGKTL